MKNKQKGFIVPLIIVIVAVLAVGGGVYVYKTKKSSTNPTTNAPETANTSTPTAKQEPEVVKPKTDVAVSSSVTVDLWSIFDKSNLALQNKDVASYNMYSYVQVTPDQASQFSQIAPYLYSQMIKVDKKAYINKTQDSKQAIFSTNPQKSDNAEEYRYTQGSISFINKDGSWKALRASPERGWSVLKSGTNKTAAQIDIELQAMVLDSDKDGLTDQEETCTGASQYDSRCVKTDPNKKDTDGDGWWDGIETEMK